MKNRKSFMLMMVVLCICISVCMSSCKGKNPDNAFKNKTNNYVQYTNVKNIESGIAWPEGQVIPTFATPVVEIDALALGGIGEEEQVTLSGLQGIVNAQKPRLILYDAGSDEGPTTWANTSTNNLDPQTWKRTDRYELVKKYMGEVKGVVLYNITPADESLEDVYKHYRNLASTIANLEKAIPMTQKTYDTYKENGINLEIIKDITDLTYDTELEIYNHLYDTYWERCTKRLLIHNNPNDPRHVRDMGAAVGAAVVFFDCKEGGEQQALYEKFLKDMEPGNSCVLGWYLSERTGMTTTTKHGISTIPADLYQSSTVYAGVDHVIQINPVPDKPELENKVYIALFISDGDNIQYNQRYMRKLWDETENVRGERPLNWTISPSLVDIGPGLMNYYYTTATENDCFVSGPSGLGYAMPENTEKGGTPRRNFLEGKDDLFKKYAELSGKYFDRAGLRVVTIWDTLNESQRSIYPLAARYLYGLTVHEWEGQDKVGVEASIANNETRIELMNPKYDGSKNTFLNVWRNAIREWDGNSALFMASQVDVWSEIKPRQMVEMMEELEEMYPDQIQFVRADHYFALYNEANKLPFDLSLSSKVSVTTADNSEAAANMLDGTKRTIWQAANAGEQTIEFNLGGTYTISRYVMKHAGDNGLESTLNTKDYTVEVSTNGSDWTVVDDYRGNEANVTDINIEKVDASHVRIKITNPGSDNIARITDVEIYGTVK